jgi:hypothetical protein
VYDQLLGLQVGTPTPPVEAAETVAA